MTRGKVYRPLANTSSKRAFGADLEIIKWLRRQGGRGRDWEFAGSGPSMSIWFNNDSLEMVYVLKWE